MKLTLNSILIRLKNKTKQQFLNDLQKIKTFRYDPECWNLFDWFYKGKEYPFNLDFLPHLSGDLFVLVSAVNSVSDWGVLEHDSELFSEFDGEIEGILEMYSLCGFYAENFEQLEMIKAWYWNQDPNKRATGHFTWERLYHSKTFIMNHFSK